MIVHLLSFKLKYFEFFYQCVGKAERYLAVSSKKDDCSLGNPALVEILRDISKKQEPKEYLSTISYFRNLTLTLK